MQAINVRYIAGNIIALVAGGLVLFIEMWTVVPAPNLPTLAFAATIPELTPWTIVVCLAAGAIAQLAARDWARTVGVFCAALALGFALLPWCLLPSTIERCEREMRVALSDRYASVAPQTAFSTRQPYDVKTAVTGFGPAGAIRTRRDLEARTRDGARLALDVYTPAVPGAHPAVVVVYGGAWIFGSRADSERSARSLAGLGYTAIAIDYRHAPAYRFPVQIDDLRDAIATIARNATAWSVDPHRVAILGFSAGAQLALLAAYAHEPLTIRAAVAYYAPTDLTRGYRLPPQPDPADVDRILRAYTGGTPNELSGLYIEASPIAHVRPGLPPTLLIGGGRDELVRISFQRRMRDALRLHGNRVAALELPWSNHAFDEVDSGTAGQIARFYTERFLAATL